MINLYHRVPHPISSANAFVCCARASAGALEWGSEQGESAVSAPDNIADARPVYDDGITVPDEDDEGHEVETIEASSPTFKPVLSDEGVIPAHRTIASPVSTIADDGTAARAAACDDVEYDESVRVHAQVTGDVVRPLRPRPSRQSPSPVTAASAADDNGERVSFEADTGVVGMSPRSRPVRAAAKKKVNYVDASYDDDLDDVDDNDVEDDGDDIDDGESHYAKESTEPDEMMEVDEELMEGGDEEDQIDADQEEEGDHDDEDGDKNSEGAVEPPILSHGNGSDDGRGGRVEPPLRNSRAGGTNADRRATTAASSRAPAARRERAPYEFDFTQFFQEHEDLDTIAGLNLPRAARARQEP